MLARVLKPGRAFQGGLLGLGLGLVVAATRSGDHDDGSEEGRKTRGAYRVAIERSRELLRRVKDEVGSPGIVVGVSVDGKAVWTEGFGLADVENRVPCTPESIMRVASISKSFTMAAIAKLWEEGRLDLDIPVQKYVPEFPEKEFEGKKVTLTTRLLVSHLSGIRHYEKDIQKIRKKLSKKTLDPGAPAAPPETDTEKAPCTKPNNTTKEPSVTGERKNRDTDLEEFYIKDKFSGVLEALELFKNDPLLFKPGTQFLYSTHAWTLLSAIVERASGKKFLDYMQQMFRELGMNNTVPEEHEPIIYNRARFYNINNKKRLVNTPYVDNSCKWAGGGFLSTVGDLLTFGNILLYSYQAKADSQMLPGYLKSDTISMVWKQVPNTEMSWDKDGKYAMGWGVVERKLDFGQCKHQRHYVSHTGGAVGASSVLLILPEEEEERGLHGNPIAKPPRGVVVTIIANMQGTNLNNAAVKIALEFETDKLTNSI